MDKTRAMGCACEIEAHAVPPSHTLTRAFAFLSAPLQVVEHRSHQAMAKATPDATAIRSMESRWVAHVIDGRSTGKTLNTIVSLGDAFSEFAV